MIDNNLFNLYLRYMTKTIVIGENTSNSKGNIDFRFFFQIDWKCEEVECGLSGYKYVELICRNYDKTDNGFDLMFAYDDPSDRGDGVLFVGRWNDGKVSS